MDIKDLNKSQLILLAVLLSFITSIATGITTVTLMQQAPVAYTAPINRIIKQTVENIVPNSTPQTVVVKEEDLVVDAIAKNKSAVFTITKDFIDQNGVKTEISAGQGFVINNDKIIVADGSWVPSVENYYVKNNSGKFKANFLFSEKGIAFLKIGDPLDEKQVVSFTVPTIGDLNKTKAGQKILILGTTISSFIFDGSLDIKINVTKSIAGGLVFNLDGEALGIALSGDATSFVSINTILESFKNSQPKP